MHGLETVLRKHKKNCQESGIWFSKTFGDKSPQSCPFSGKRKVFSQRKFKQSFVIVVLS